MSKSLVTFSFGKNWKSFVRNIGPEDLDGARRDIVSWLGENAVAGKKVLDIGCGSGIHSLCFYQLGARELVSFDYDRHSVEATRTLWEQAGRPANWSVLRGSVLDGAFLRAQGVRDIVYSWGCLHHTGALWSALANACSAVRSSGLLWIAIYAAGPLYPAHLGLKQKYNLASEFEKKIIVGRRILQIMYDRYRNRQNPFTWNQRTSRGMNIYHDLVDWYGGLPYEVASVSEVVQFCQERGLERQRVLERTDGANSVYLFRRA
jgi:2-polyprenyl-3-methyl-5-hydroxy-6-metoxy-1,4-benzoquinol methylase